MPARTRILSIQSSSSDQRLLRALVEELPSEEITLSVLYTPEEGLDQLQDRSFTLPNLILMGWYFPMETGLRLLQALKADEHLRPVPVVVLASSLTPAQIQAIYTEQAACVIEIPNNLENLQELLRVLRALWLNVARLPYERNIVY